MSGSRKRLLSLALIAMAIISWSATAIAQAQDEQASVKKFVQEFYTWYGAISHKNNKLAPDQRATKEKAQLFSAKLIAALKEDYQESSKHPEEIVGLDWDPFLCSQDIDDRYEVGAIKKQDHNYLVEVYGVSEGKRNKEPNVIAEVAQNEGRWIFVNFLSPHGGDLLGDLRQLKESRKKPYKKGAA